MAQCNENCERRARSDKRISLLADRLAIALVVLKMRYGSDWEPWFGEACWDAADSLGDEVRAWKEYAAAKEIVKLFLKRQDRRIKDEMAMAEKESKARQKQGLEPAPSGSDEAAGANE